MFQAESISGVVFTVAVGARSKSEAPYENSRAHSGAGNRSDYAAAQHSPPTFPRLANPLISGRTRAL